MKEPGNSVVSTADPGRKRKKRKGGTSFSNSKQRRRRELRKREQTGTQGSEPQTDLSKTGGEDETGTTSRNEHLQRIEEEQEQSGSREPSMGESEQRSNSDTSGSEEETKDEISTVRRVECTKDRYTCRLFIKLELKLCKVKQHEQYVDWIWYMTHKMSQGDSFKKPEHRG